MAGIFPNSGVPAGDAINSVNVATTGCGLGNTGELFHSTSRCQPRFDPAAANAIMSEILNFVALGDVAYDCSRLDNMSTSVRLAFARFLESCMEIDLPDVSDTCGTTRQLVLVQDGDCFRLATSNSNFTTASATWGDYQGHLPANTGGHELPLDFASPTNYYTLDELRTADNLGTGTINETRMLNSVLVSLSFTNLCSKRYRLLIEGAIASSLDADEAYRRRSQFVYRFRQNGGAWQYARSLGVIQQFGSLNGINVSYSEDVAITLPAGEIDVQVVYTAEQVGDTPAPVILSANTNISGPTAGAGSPRASLRPDL